MDFADLGGVYVRISEMKNEAALAALSDIVEPVLKIAQDDKFKKAARANDLISVVKILSKDHARETLDLLAIFDGQDPATYEVSFFELPAKIMDLVNTPEIQTLFFSGGNQGEKASSGNVSESTEAPAE